MSTKNIVKKRIGKNKIYINKSHLFPTYYKNEPFYDRALPRICQYIKDKDGYLKLIDIGANIGDTIALVRKQVSGEFLAIEGEKNFLKLLEKNIKLYKNSYVEIEKSFCGIDKRQNYTIKSQHGTASLTTGEDKSKKIKKIPLKSLDNILKEHPKFKDANILKIDTDGFEINVLKGSINFLKNFKPVLYFEYTPHLYK